MRFRPEKLGFSPAEDLFSWRLPEFGQKNRLNFSEDLFFWRPPKFGHTNRLHLIEDR